MDGSSAPSGRLGPALVEVLTDLFADDPRVVEGHEPALARTVVERLRNEDVLDAMERIANFYAAKTEATPGLYARAALWHIAGAD